MHHGSINVDPANTGLRTTDGTQHYEQELHLKFAGRKRRRDVSPTDSKSRQIVLHTPTNRHQHVNDWRRVSCASESPMSCLRCSLTVPAVRTSCFAVVVGLCSFCHSLVTQQAVHCQCHRVSFQLCCFFLVHPPLFVRT